MDIKQEALDAGMERIRGYMNKGLSRGKISPKAETRIHPPQVDERKAALALTRFMSLHSRNIA